MTETAYGNAQDLLVELTADIVAAYVSNHVVPVTDLPGLISDVHTALSGTSAPASVAVNVEKQKPAVSVRKSVQDDHIVCLECGGSFKSLKRHLTTHHSMTPEEYREKWDLPVDYPMVAPAYAEARSRLAKEMGLGQRRKASR
ncbi:MucR family transcriptional regulator [Agrobacterium genomosp. 3]|jgi:predicted transcriptional regulator|uniref:Transcriptional regulator n=7 Tax=Rhizobiaceae TaxID=82115 RepID=A0A178H8A6_RHIRH|nr:MULTISPECIES: MucR family transcriptional regulator Ros [Rhizobium/Agrobacterium group]EGP57689.1 transcriptional regulator [Agrobacterium tumefaciens F2]MBA4774862.1 MucR family transcriptional regulator [Hyphomicrobiales bacterium]MCA1866453.1 MucR family transcriptional regulator [Agrobacterium tomkonis]MCA2379920.1 MucR family transcriptional regulator Ros [Agrobacterium tomkonis RTP8]MCW0980025.1 MucR family transcriptional regulator Ros [Agrobacterium sp. BT-220-3]PNQ25194.1 transcri